jgi:uncharacterized membrane protein (DUF4010 family)
MAPVRRCRAVRATVGRVNEGFATTWEGGLLKLSNPFELATALKPAGFIAVISVLAKFVSETISHAGVRIVAAISGLADVDALTLSMTRLSPHSVPATPRRGLTLGLPSL